MKMIRNFLTVLLALFFAGFTSLSIENKNSEGVKLVGSTPGGKVIKNILGIYLKDSIDFIRWNIFLDSSSGTFKVELQYGISKPDTKDFITPKSKIFQGKFIVKSGVYILKSSSLAMDLKFIKINDHLFHFLGNDESLLVGNGGWSYVLNNSSGLQVSELEGLKNRFLIFGEKDSILIFDGRTPCDQIPGALNLPVSNDCIKLKWRLKLMPGDDSGNTGTYSLKGTFSNHKEVTGKYSITAHPQQQRLFILQLSPSSKERKMNFLIVDKSILYFLNSDMKLFVGDSNFSYALNRIAQ